MKYAYVRVSSIDQNEARQVEALEKHGIDKWFVEKVSGKDTNRPQLQELLGCVQEGDTVYIHELSRLARSTKDLLTIVEILTEKKVHLVSNKESIDTSTATGKLILTVIAAIAEFERQNLLERQREGIEIAKRNGVYKERCGRHDKKVDEQAFRENYEQLKSGAITKTEMAAKLRITRTTLNKMIEKREAA